MQSCEFQHGVTSVLFHGLNKVASCGAADGSVGHQDTYTYIVQCIYMYIYIYIYILYSVYTCIYTLCMYFTLAIHVHIGLKREEKMRAKYYLACTIRYRQ